MKKFRTIIVMFSLILFSASCSTYTVETEIKKGDKLSSLKKSGIIFRIPKNSFFDQKDYIKSLTFWLNGYTNKNQLGMITDISDPVVKVNLKSERFYQTSIEDDFLKYKSIGILRVYLRNNSPELKKIIKDNRLDSLIIYEVDSVYSSELQFLDFNSVMAIVDAELNILLLDHQIDLFDISYVTQDGMKHTLLDKISERAVEKFIDLGYLEEK